MPNEALFHFFLHLFHFLAKVLLDLTLVRVKKVNKLVFRALIGSIEDNHIADTPSESLKRTGIIGKKFEITKRHTIVLDVRFCLNDRVFKTLDSVFVLHEKVLIDC